MRAHQVILLLSAAVAFGFGVSMPCSHWAHAQENPGSASSLTPYGSPQRFRDEIKQIEDSLPRVADRGAALFLLAHHYARIAETAKALTLLKECVALDEGFDLTKESAFRSMKNEREFREIVEQARRRNPPVHHAHVAFTLPDKDLFPEGLAVDAEKRLFYMGSMHRKKIVKFTTSGEVSDFVPEDRYGLNPAGGVRIDPMNHDVWVASDPTKTRTSELLHFDSQGKLLGRFLAPGPGDHDLNDLVVRGEREIYTTDTFANQVYRFDRVSQRFTPVTFPRPIFEPNGITFSNDENVMYVADDLGVLRVDLRNNEIQDVRPAPHDTLAGIDGLYWYKGSLVGVQYGTGAYRVMRWTLSPDGRAVTLSEVLERGTELVNNPTTGAIFEGNFYFMANTGIYNLENDRIVDESKLEAVKIAVVALK